MIPTCPKCQAQYTEKDNFCVECGKNLRIIKTQENKDNKKYRKKF